MTLGTPHNIEVLLHIHYSASLHPRIETQMVRDTVVMLLDAGAIRLAPERDSKYATTPHGDAWVRALCAVPIPKVIFLDQGGNPI